LEVGICFAEREPSFSALPESLCGDEDAGEYGVVEGFWGDAGECECCCAGEHRVIKAEDIDAREVGEHPEILVKPVEVLLDAALVFVQDSSRDACFLRFDVTCWCCPGEESSYGICLTSWLAFGADRLSCFSEADVRKVDGEFASVSAFQEFCRRRDLMVCRCGIREEPVGFYENMRHEL